MDQITSSNGENTSEIQSLTRQIQELEPIAARWDGWYISLAGVTVCMAALLFFVQFVSHGKNKKLQTLQARLLKLKDNELATDLKNKDVEISHAHNEAKQAGDRASHADQRAGEANADAGKANVRAGNLENEAANARSETEKLKERNLATEKTLEEERSTRLDLEDSLVPRELFIFTYVDGTSNIDGLKKFSGTNVLIEHIPDFEAERAARFIASVLAESRWQILGVEPSKEYMFDGVEVERYQPPKMEDTLEHPEFAPLDDAMHASERACEAVVDFLTVSNWGSMTGLAYGIPEGSVRIRVGFRPNPYFLPKPFKDANKAVENIRKSISTAKKSTNRTGSIRGVMPWQPPPTKP